MQKQASLLSTKIWISVQKCYNSVSDFRSQTYSELNWGQNYRFAICADKIFAQLLIECHSTKHCPLLELYILEMSWELFALLHLCCPFFVFFTDLTTFFCLKMLLFLSMILLPIIFTIKWQTIHRSSGEYTVHKSSLYALRNNSVCINKGALPLITIICFRVFNNTVFNKAGLQFLILNVYLVDC